jgi:hypothetical protein
MKRLHLFEFEDQEWFPELIRNYMTDYLQIIATTMNFYESVIPIIQKGVEKSGTNLIIDMASGGGGGWLAIAQKIIESIPNVQVKLTDFYPNLEAFKKTQQEFPHLFDYVETPVDATDVPENLVGLRTQFLSFHHFKPEAAKKILQNAVNARQPIAVFEAVERNAEGIVKALGVPLTTYALTPFIKPFSLKRLFYTYVFPVVPFFTGFDGFVSVFRMYSQEEMKALVDSLHNTEKFEWEIGLKRNGIMSVQYLLGYPK